jgi:uncharacterized protein YuzE
VRLKYYRDTDSLYIELSSKPSAQSQEIAEGFVLDYAEDGSLVGIDIDNANCKIDRDEITLSKLPTEGEKMLA